MEKIKYSSSYKLKEDSVEINIEDVCEDDFIYMLGKYSYDGEDPYGKSTGWEHVNYDFIYKIKFDGTQISDHGYRQEYGNATFKSKNLLVDYVKKNSRINTMFEKKHIDFTFYKKESIIEAKTPREHTYYCDTCGQQYNAYAYRIVRNHKQTSMKVLKDGTHKCFKCCNIGRHLPSIVFNLKINSRELLNKLFKILKSNSWQVEKKDNEVLIRMIMRDKVDYVKNMIDELNHKANFDLKFVKTEKFYNPQRSEKIYHYKMN